MERPFCGIRLKFPKSTFWPRNEYFGNLCNYTNLAQSIFFLFYTEDFAVTLTFDLSYLV